MPLNDASQIRFGEWLMEQFGQELVRDRRGRERVMRALALGPAAVIRALPRLEPQDRVLPAVGPAKRESYLPDYDATPVFASLVRDRDSNLEGWYLYTKYSKQIELEGKIDKNGGFQLDEKSFQTTRKTGSLSGTAKQGIWSVPGKALAAAPLSHFR